MKKCVFTLSLILSSLLMANTQTDELFSMSLEELINVEIESSTHTKEDMFSVPSSVTVFTYEQIRKMSVSNLDDLMNYVPGFQANKGNFFPNGKVNSTRGKFTSSGQRDILVILDGQRLNSTWNGAALDINNLFSLENVERIEFIKGPGSAIYGSNAFLGVINIYTKKDLNNVGVRFNQDYVNGYLNYTYKEDDLRISSFVKGIYDEGYEYDSEVDVYTGNTRKPKDKNDGEEFYINGKYKDVSLQIRHVKRESESSYSLGYSSKQSSVDTQQDFFRTSYEYDELQDYVAKLSLSYIESSTKSDVIYAPLSKAKYEAKDSSIDINFDNAYNINEDNNLQFGLEYRHTKMLDNEMFSSQIVPLNSNDIYGLYAQYQTKVSDFSFTLGARYDDYENFGDSFNPRLAAVYTPNKDTSFKLLYGSAFRAPTVRELYASANGFTNGNPNLNPEEIDTYEFIIVHKLYNHIINLSYYYSVIDNVIVDTGIGHENGSEEKYSGLEAELISSYLDDDFSTRFGFSHVLSSDQVSDITPDTTISAIANYRLKKFNFNLNAFYHSSSYSALNTATAKKLNDYTIFNTKVMYDISSDLMVYFEMENILDEGYETPAVSDMSRFEIQNRGRLSYIGLEYRF